MALSVEYSGWAKMAPQRWIIPDGEGALRCVMFRSDAQSLRFRPENGMQVIAAGRVTVFPRDGQYQMYCARLTPEGVGDLALAFEQLKEKLAQEGLFDPAHKNTSCSWTAPPAPAAGTADGPGPSAFSSTGPPGWGSGWRPLSWPLLWPWPLSS